MADDRPTLKFKLPLGEAQYPRLNKPDEKWKKYGLSVRIPDAAFAKLGAQLSAFHQDEECRKAVIPAKRKRNFEEKALPWKPAEDWIEDDSEEGGHAEPVKGFVDVRVSRKGSYEKEVEGTGEDEGKKVKKVIDNPPERFDRFGRKFTDPESEIYEKIIGRGSKVIAAGYAVPYYNEGYGITLRLDVVVVMELVERDMVSEHNLAGDFEEPVPF